MPECCPQSNLCASRQTALKVIFDRNHKGQGRGAYLCYKKECVEKAKKRQSLERALKRPVPQPIWIELEKAVEDATAKREE